MENETATPNATPQPSADDANRTAGSGLDAGIQQYQAQIDAIVQSRLAEQARRLQAKYGDLDELAKAKQELDAKREAEMSEMERLQRKITDMEAEQQRLIQQAETERLNALRLRVGQELGLPPVLSARLQGADEAALKADAEAVKAVLQGSPNVTIPNLNATAGGGQPSAVRVQLTPSQRTAAERAVKGGLFKSVEEYAQAMQEMQGEH